MSFKTPNPNVEIVIAKISFIKVTTTLILPFFILAGIGVANYGFYAFSPYRWFHTRTIVFPPILGVPAFFVWMLYSLYLIFDIARSGGIYLAAKKNILIWKGRKCFSGEEIISDSIALVGPFRNVLGFSTSTGGAVRIPLGFAKETPDEIISKVRTSLL